MAFHVRVAVPYLQVLDVVTKEEAEAGLDCVVDFTRSWCW